MSRLVVALAMLAGLVLIEGEATHLSATYDEVTYLRVGARWWRTGEQEAITRLGSPLSVWKIQQAPTLWLIDHLGDPSWIDDPIAHQARLLPWIRRGGAWVWVAALLATAALARRLGGDGAMALAAAIFALEPNLLAHGALATMELPMVAALGGMLLPFHRFLGSGRRRDLLASAAVGGLAFSCKYTTILVPPILAVVWAVDRWLARDRSVARSRTLGRIVAEVGVGMIGFGAVMLASNLVVTGFALVPLSARSGDHPIAGRLPLGLGRLVGPALESRLPADWVGFATQVLYQREGGPSYLLGERRLTGWWYYYPVTLAVKVPLAFWVLVVGGAVGSFVRARQRDRRAWALWAVAGFFLLAAVLGSKRNYGVRYLLPVAPPVIAAAAAGLMTLPGRRRLVALGLAGMAASVATIHPYELAYFNLAAGGPVGGRRILADSNLDWGQGAVAMARLQASDPGFRDLTWYAFGDTDPGHYGAVGTRYLLDAHEAPSDLPPTLSARTRYLAVSASLQWGPWGPAGYFRELDGVAPVRYSDDWSVAIYRTADLDRARAGDPGRGPRR